MANISENEVEKLKQAINSALENPVSLGTKNKLDAAYDLINAIQPAPQSDEVMEAVKVAQAWVDDESASEIPFKHSPEIEAVETLLRAAQSAPVDLERVRAILTDMAQKPELNSWQSSYMEGFCECKKIMAVSASKALALLPTPSKE